jgi:rfaE bifunctional protein nucleotidyltransferase chain/domain
MNSRSKILDRATLIEQVREIQGRGQTVVLANGLFDILHVGHLRYLEAAAGEADRLLVAVNSDDSARRLKGPSRPIVPAFERAELIAAFACVNLVTVFDESTVEPLLRAIHPQVHCKGTDYTADNLPEANVAAELGIRIAIVGDRKTHATRDIIRQIQQSSD